MSRMKNIFFGVLSALLLLTGCILFFLSTTKGLYVAINSVVRWVPGLDIASIDGNWSDLTMKGIKYQMPGIMVTVRDFHLSLDLSCFKYSSLCINTLTAQDVNVSIKNKEKILSPFSKNIATSTTYFNTPYPIIVRTLALNNLKIILDNTTILLNEFQSGGKWNNHELTLMPTKINSLLIMLPQTPKKALLKIIQPMFAIKKEIITPIDTIKQLTSQLRESSLGEILKTLFSKPLVQDFPKIRLPLDIFIKEIKGEHLKLVSDTTFIISNLLLKVRIKNQHIKLDDFNIQLPQGTLSAQGEVTLIDDLVINLFANSILNIEPIKGEKLALNLNGRLHQKLKMVLNVSGTIDAQLNLQTCLTEIGLPLVITVQSKEFKWPINKKWQHQINNFYFHFNGKVTDYTVSTHANINAYALPPAMLRLDATGNVEQFNLKRLRLSALQGNTDLTALVDWSNAITWNAQLTLSGINSIKHWPKWPMKINARILTHGILNDRYWQINIPMLQLDGNVKNNKVTARGMLSGNAIGQWKIPGISLSLGTNTVHFLGNLDKNYWNLDAKINAPHLNDTLPGLGGIINGNLKVRGNLEKPQLLANLTAYNLKWQTLCINRIKIDSNVYSTNQMHGQLSVRVEQIKKNISTIKLLKFNINGNEKNHQIHLEIDSHPFFGQLKLQGDFNRQQQRWHGNLNNSYLNTPVGKWNLNDILTLDYWNTDKKINIGPHCWKHINAELCIPKTIKVAKIGELNLMLNHFNLKILKPLLREETTLSGISNWTAKITWKLDDDFPEVRFLLVGNNIKVVHQINGNTLPIAINALRLNGLINTNYAQVAWLTKLKNNGQCEGHIQVIDQYVQRNIRGYVNITNVSLAIIQPSLMRNERTSGVLNAKMRLGGNVYKPQVFGWIALDNIYVDSHTMPFNMINSRLVIKFNGMNSTIDGLIRTNRGQINLAGYTDWRDLNACYARITAQGTKVRLTMPPMIYVDVSPNLVFEASPQLFSLYGSVDIPWARIKVKELPKSVVDISSDEVMLNKQLKPIQPKSTAISINSNIMIHISKDVLLEAFGLKAELQGDLKMMHDKKGLGLNGQINISSGRFYAYGQDLIVRKGQLIFSGSPNQPILNIEAIRNPESTEDNITAGVRVTGLMDSPKLEVFSDPSKSKQEALSYLLRGQGLYTSVSDSNTMTSMLIGMGVAQSGQLVGKIGKVFGVTDLLLDTQGVGVNAKVIVSGYVLPGLQVKYGVGIFDSLAMLTLRYRLMPKLYLEAISSLDKTLDLLYQFEF